MNNCRATSTYRYAAGMVALCVMVLYGSLIPEAKLFPKPQDYDIATNPVTDAHDKTTNKTSSTLKMPTGTTPDNININPREIMPGKMTVVPLDTEAAQPDLFAQQQARFLAKATPEQPLTIYLFPLHMVSPTHNFIIDELKHFVYDGIMQSPYMNVSTNVHDIHNHDLWMAQTTLGFAPSRWCKRFSMMVGAIKVKKREERPPIVLMNWQDGADLFSCTTAGVHELASLMGGTDRIFYTKRGIVRNRRYNSATNEIEDGAIDTFSNWSAVAGAPLRHTPYAVRSDFVHALEQVVYYGNITATTPSWVETDAVGLHRSKDVVQFWPLEGNGVDRGGRMSNSKLRDAVSRLLEELGASIPGLKTFAGLAGEANLVGRNQVDLIYATSILEYKIVVVAQKDRHEEHYRLMEAIASGAMILSDVMLSMPKDFVDGESIVFYKNMSDLKSKIMYYLEHEEERLAIAKRGWTLAMHRHRSWHRMEELVFGKILSPAIATLVK